MSAMGWSPGIRLASPPSNPDCSNIVPGIGTIEFFWSQQPPVPVPPLTVEGMGSGHGVGGKTVYSPDVRPRNRNLRQNLHERRVGQARLLCDQSVALWNHRLGGKRAVWRLHGRSVMQRTGR